MFRNNKLVIHAISLVTFLFAIAVSFFSFRNTSNYIKKSTSVSHTYQVFTLLESIYSELANTQNNLLLYSINGTPLRLQDAILSTKSINAREDNYESLIVYAPLKLYSDSLQSQIDNYFADIVPILRKQINQDERMGIVRKGEANIDNVRRLIDKMEVVNNEALVERKEDSRAILTQLYLTLILSFSMLTLIIIGYVYLTKYNNKKEIELIKAKESAEESTRAKQQFLANMSHEIRTPMNAIIGIAQLMQDTRIDEQQKEYLHSINFAGENLLRIINDILEVAKIEAGKMNIEKTDFDITKTLTDVIKTLDFQAKEKKLQLILEIADGIPPVLIGGPMRINQILINVIGNAIKFTEKGYVKLLVQEKEKSVSGVILKFSVEDTGIGIPKEKQEKIFDAFEQVHKSSGKRYGGTGLGLSIVKRLVELQNGSIYFKSEVGKGSLFTFELPFGIGEKAEFVKEQKLKNKVSLAGKEALLVEDDKLNQMIAEKFLEGMGLRVDVVDNGIKAIDILKNKTYDLILMDIQMPQMNGYETTRHIRKMMSGKTKKEIPILALTANVLQGEENKCLEAGMNGYISKPINRNILQEKIMSILN